MADILELNSGENWSLGFTCTKCGSQCQATAPDLEADEFHVSGYHFAGTWVGRRRLYVVCPACTKCYFLTDEEAAAVPHLLNQQGEDHYHARRAREDAAARVVQPV